ncbi:hypothetical protein AWB67_05462 [Caballeronia terrestris]|jgi:hypothetical protein|uniref:Uncharacterized protein n=1 Tax=Caballeronia terrestris TaxID=1226301 RepID=A0A158KEF4_9BURK|nr:hypothetical protein AWB67_05462 [Caballeronia terrestris]
MSTVPQNEPGTDVTDTPAAPDGPADKPSDAPEDDQPA